MTDETACIVQQAVRQFLRQRAFDFDIGKPQHFEELVEHVRVRLSAHQIQVDEDDLRVVTAMCCLGLEFDTIPPDFMRAKLLGIIRQSSPDPAKRISRLMEFAIAYGCGWGRDILSAEDWGKKWSNAVNAISRTVEPAVSQANRWLCKTVKQFPERTLELPGDSSRLATGLVWPLRPLHIYDVDTVRMECTDDDLRIRPVNAWKPEAVPPGAKIVFTASEASLEIEGNGEETRSVMLPAESRLIVSMHDEDASIEATRQEWLMSGVATFRSVERTILRVRLPVLGDDGEYHEQTLDIDLPPGKTVGFSQTDAGMCVEIGDRKYLVPSGKKIVLSIGKGKAAFMLPDGRDLPIGGGWRITISCGDNGSLAESRRGAKMSIGETALLTGEKGFSVTQWACPCGTKQCAERHGVESWRPDVASLWAYIGSAVKGPNAGITSGSFAQGMYYTLLVEGLLCDCDKSR